MVTQEHGDIRVLAFVATKSHSEFKSALVKMRESLKKYGHLQPRIFYTDNPSADKHFLETIFESLKADVVPVKVHPTLKPYVLPEDVVVAVHSSAAEINGVCDSIADDVDVTDDTAYIKVAFDGEYNVRMVRGGGLEPTSITQLAYKKRVDIFQVSLLNHVNLQTLTMIEDWTFQWQPSNIISIPACKSKNLESGS